MHRPYHHGDARNALLRAASQLLEQEGAASVSLRAIAERAGLSRQAPYNHFADKEALFAELARQGFLLLAEVTDRAAAATSAAEARLARAGAAYIAFAQEAPARFRLMFGREFVDLKRHGETAQAAQAAFGRLVAIVAALVDPGRVEEFSLAAWCLMHGYATLRLEMGIEGGPSDEARAALFARMVAAANAPEGSGLVERPELGEARQ